MPVEILELNVRANVKENTDCDTTQGRQHQPATNGNVTGNNSASSGNQSIIQECVAQVMEILRRNQER